MKKIFIALLILYSCTSIGFCQTELTDSVTSGKGYTGYGYPFKKGCITVWDDGKIDIKGDTMQAISKLFEIIKENEKREMDLWDFVGGAIAFTDNVPDYWKNSKNNKGWKKYYGELKKLGYKNVKIK